MQNLLKNFIVAADEVWRLQNGTDPECKLFQGVMEFGHYGGRVQPTNTRQGTYALTPSGLFLASVNTNDPKQMAAMLERALEKWKTLSREERLRSNETPGVEEAKRAENLYPEDGLVLRVFCRDLPREQQAMRPNDWRKDAWNQDYAWFKKAEARQFVATDPVEGATHEVPRGLVIRLARANFVDIVRGQSYPYDEKAIESANLVSRVEKVDGDLVTIRMAGETRTNQTGNWSINGFQDMGKPSPQTRGVETKILGFAKFNLRTAKFTEFSLVALGTRWGATQYNGRADDLGPAPIGFAAVLAGGTSAERVAPSHFWVYGWR